VLKHTYPNDDLCEAPNLTVHAVGDAIDAADVYSDANGTCQAVDQPDTRFFAIGGEAADGVLPALTLAEAGAGRLTIQHVASPDGKLVATQTGVWRDSERDESCYPIATADGARCLPAMILTPDTNTSYYADVLCTVQLVDHVAACSTAPPEYVGVLAAPTNSCASGAVDTLYSLGVQHTGPVYQGDVVNCTEGTFDGVDFYAIGAEVALTEFAPLAEATLATK
jgi:hypothetical protein